MKAACLLMDSIYSLALSDSGRTRAADEVPVIEENPHFRQDGFHPGGIIHGDVDQFEGGDASSLCYRLVVDPGLDHRISRIPNMFFKESNQPVGSLSLGLLELEVPFHLPELDLQFFLFPDQLVDLGVPFRHFLFSGHLGQCCVYVSDGDVT